MSVFWKWEVRGVGLQ